MEEETKKCDVQKRSIRKSIQLIKFAFDSFPMNYWGETGGIFAKLSYWQLQSNSLEENGGKEVITPFLESFKRVELLA